MPADASERPPAGLNDELLAQLNGQVPTEALDLSRRNLEPIDLRRIIKAINGNPHLKSLCLADNNLTNFNKDYTAMADFGKVLPSTSLTALDISKNNLTNFGNDQDMLSEFMAVLPSTSLTSLNLASNHAFKKGLGEEKWGKDNRVLAKLAEVLPTTSITSLNLADNRLESEPVLLLAEAFQKASKLSSVDFSDNRLCNKELLDAVSQVAPAVKLKASVAQRKG